MKKRLTTFAALGTISLLLFLLSILYSQFFNAIVESFPVLKNVDLRVYEKDSFERRVFVYRSGLFLIYLLALFLLDAGYRSLSRIKKSRACALMGLFGSRVFLVVVLVSLARAFLFDSEVTLESVDNWLRIYRFLAYLALGGSALLSMYFFENAFLRFMCSLGAFGWFNALVESLLAMFFFSPEFIRSHREHYELLRAVFLVWEYVVSILVLVSFVAILFSGREGTRLEESDYRPYAQEEGLSEMGGVWAKCTMALLTLVVVVFPLFIVPFCINYPSFSKSILFGNYRQSVLAFKVFCTTLGGLAAIGCLHGILPFLSRGGLGRMFCAMGERLGAREQAVPARSWTTPYAGPGLNPTMKAKERLLELRQMFDEGLITQAEYEQKRARILAEV